MAKTEREKMLANELYRAVDKKLVALQRLAQSHLYRFNHAQPEEVLLRKGVVRSLAH